MLLAHGFGGSARNWRPQARALADRARTVIFDVRGHARSEAPDDPAAYRASAFFDDFDRARRWGAGPEADGAAGPAPPAVVGGLSMGASLALRYVLARPEGIRGMVLAAFPPAEAPRARGEVWAECFATAIETEGLEAAGAVYAWGPEGGFDPKAAALVKAGFLEHPAHAVVHTLRELLAHPPDLAALGLEACFIPTLVVVGSRDRLSLSPCRDLAARLPRAELLEVEGAGHVVNLEAREAVSDALANFLEGLPGGLS